MVSIANLGKEYFKFPEGLVIKRFVLIMPLFYCQMFEAPVTFIESKKQKTLFEDVDGNKVIGYLEKDSPGMSNNINFPDFNTFSYIGVIRYRWTGKSMILGTRYQGMSNSSIRLQNSPYFCVGQESASGDKKGLEGRETGERREKY